MRSALVALLVLLGFAAIFAETTLLRVTRGQVGAALVHAVSALLALALVPRLGSPRLRLRAAVTLMLLAAPIALASLADLSARSIVPSRRYEPDALELAATSMIVMSVSALVMIALGGALGHRLAGGSAWIERAVRSLAWPVVLAGAAVLAGAGLRARRPLADDYVASLQVVSVLPPAPDEPRAMSAEQREARVVLRGANDVPVCNPKVTLRRDGGRAPTGDPLLHDIGFSRCGPVLVRRAARGFVILEDEGGGRVAYRRFDAHPRPLRANLIPGALRPPDALTALGAVGVLSAIAILVRRRRSILPEDDSACRDADLHEGRLLLQDRTELRLPAGTTAAPGPCVVVLSEPAGSFRDHAGPQVARLHPGTLAEHRRADRVEPSAVAMAAVLITVAPLATALAVLR